MTRCAAPGRMRIGSRERAPPPHGSGAMVGGDRQGEPGPRSPRCDPLRRAEQHRQVAPDLGVAAPREQADEVSPRREPRARVVAIQRGQHVEQGMSDELDGHPGLLVEPHLEGEDARTRLTSRAIARKRPRRHAQTCGGTKYTTGMPMPARRPGQPQVELGEIDEDECARAAGSRAGRAGRGTPPTARGAGQSTSVAPTTVTRSARWTTATPAAAIRAPPIPASFSPGASVGSALASVAPWRSPDASPATIRTSVDARTLRDPDNAHPGRAASA